MILRRQAKSTLTAVEMMHGDTLEFELLDGGMTRIELMGSEAEIIRTTLKNHGEAEKGATTLYRFWADVQVNGEALRLEREVGTQASFYEPWTVAGVQLWLDVVDDVFTFLKETHGPCRPQENCMPGLPPRRHARLALQDVTARICPERVHPWGPLPERELKIADCYRGEDCWIGAFDGASAHGGLDINHPRGTPLFAPIDLDYHFLYNSTERGWNNNRWRGMRQWDAGATWILSSCHMTRLTVPEYTSLRAGAQYAEGAGVCIGAVEHSHFGFAIIDHGEMIRLDPWILFRQMYRDQAGEDLGHRQRAIAEME